MAEITNLNKYRKTKERAQKEIKAQNNRILYGTPKAIKNNAKANNLIAQKRLRDKEIKDE